MRLQTRSAKVYVGLSFAAAMAIGILSLPLVDGSSTAANAWLLFAVLMLSAAALNFFRVFGAGKLENYDVAWALYGFTAISLGFAATLAVILVANLSTLLLRPKLWPWYVHGFNISSFYIAAGISAPLFARLAAPGTANNVVAICVMATVFTLINHAHVAGILWLNNRVKPFKSGLFRASSLLADAGLIGIGGLCALAASWHPAAIALGVPPLVLIYIAMRAASPKMPSAARRPTVQNEPAAKPL
jgi:hypothetical protein